MRKDSLSTAANMPGWLVEPAVIARNYYSNNVVSKY